MNLPRKNVRSDGTASTAASPEPMMLADFVDEVTGLRKTFVVYASEESADVEAHFETRNVTVEHETIAQGGPDGFVVLRDARGFVGAFSLSRLLALLEPPVFRPWNREEVSEPWQALYEILNETLFASFDRRQLLAATREIENRAWRVGAGIIRVGFQSSDALAAQADVYRRLAAETDLAIHVYVADDQEVPSLPGVEIFRAEGTEVGDYWFLAYDAAGDPVNACGLVAEEQSPGSYFGFWTYDPERVDDLSTYLRQTYE